MKNELDTAMQRTRQYWYVDGLNEMAFGAISLLLGVYFYTQATLPPDSLLYRILDTAFVLILVGGGLLANRIVSRIKATLTYPRTGYVSYPQPSKNRRLLLALVAMLVAALVSMFLILTPASLDWMPAISGLVVGGVWLFIAIKIGITRFYLLAAVSLILGGALAVSGLDNILAVGIYYASMAVAMFISGGLTLLRYLRTSRPPAEEAR